MKKKFVSIRLGLICLLSSFLWPLSVCPAETMSCSDNLDPEKWALCRIRSGKSANFRDKGREKSRVSGKFLTRLLRGQIATDLKKNSTIVIAFAQVDGTVDLSTSNVNFGLEIDAAVFKGSLQLQRTIFVSDVILKNCIFESVADFRQIKVGRELKIEESVFKASASFRDAEISESFFLRRTTFAAEGYTFDFDGLDVRESFILTHAEFFGETKFTHARIGRNFDAENARFRGIDDSLKKYHTFNYLRTGGNVSFRDAIFENDVEMNGMVVGHNFELDRTIFEKYAKFEGTRVKMKAVLNKTVFEGDLFLDGLKYGAISGGSGNGSKPWRDLISYVEQSKFSSEAYTELQNHFERIGDIEAAGETFYRHQERIRNEKKLSRFGEMRSFALRLLVGHGRYPFLSLLPLAIFQLIGWFVFRKGMIEINPNLSVRYSSFWYSLDLLIPFLDLNIAKHWVPETRCRVCYMRIHRLIGWILVPVGLAGFYGIIK